MPDILIRLLPLYSISKALFNSYISYYIIFLGNSISFLDYKVVIGSLVRRNYLSYYNSGIKVIARAQRSKNLIY